MSMEKNTEVRSRRDTWIPVTYTCPDGVDNCPLVIGFHGYQSSRHEFGMFDQCAARLAEKGIAMVRLDFPGNNDSKEPFTRCTLKHMHDDVDQVLAYVREEIGLTCEKVGFLGYSMGGLTALTYMNRTGKEPDALALWSPGVHMRGFLERTYTAAYGGLQKLMERGKADGTVHLVDQWSDTEVSYELILDMVCENPLQRLRDYKGEFFLVGGESDTILKSEDFHLADLAAVNARSKKTLFLNGTDHDLGSAWGNEETADQAAVEQVLSGTVQFFAEALLNTEK